MIVAKAGEAQRQVLPAVTSLPFWLYQPQRLTTPDRMIVAVHGISREYEQQLDAYKVLADRMGCWLLVPEFGREQFRSYQRLAKQSNDLRADVELNSVLVALKSRLQQPFLKLHLCGYSGGAQFAHRYALLHPQKLASLVVSSAGWYTFPDSTQNYPYGIARWPRWMAELKLQEMLEVPLLVMVGSDDTGREKSLRQTPRLDRQQGVHRLERAERWVAAQNKMRSDAQVKPVKFHKLTGVGHDFSACFQQGEMQMHIEHFWKNIEGVDQCVA